MPAHVTILCGPARSGKTERGLARYRQALRQAPIGATLWLSPNWRAATEVRGRLLDGTLSGCFQPSVMTFGNFAEAVLHAAELPIRPMTRLMKRELVRQIIFEQATRGRLRHFQSIAKTAGLVDLVCEFISELKRLEIWPDDFRKACTARGLDQRDVELSEIYDVYQQALREHGLFDAEGRFWSARDVLARGEGRGTRGEGREARDEGQAIQSSASDQANTAPSPLAPLPSLIVVDGFTDFTRTQHEILAILASRGAEMLVTLPLEAAPRRDDLFAKPLKTLAELRRRHVGAMVETLDRPTSSAWPAMTRLEQTLFENPRARASSGPWSVAGGQCGSEDAGTEDKAADRSAAADCETRNEGCGESSIPGSQSLTSDPSSILSHPSSPDGSLRIEILAAARQIGEIELIAGRIKRLLVDGEARPGEIAVVFRSQSDSSRLIDEVFARYGIPTVLESGQSLDHCPALRALATLLQLDLDDWPFERLLAVLGNNYFCPNWPEWRRASLAGVERTIRELQIPRGCKSLIEQLTAAIDDPDQGSAKGDFSHKSTLAVIERLAGVFDALPQRATLPDWGKAWRRLAEQTGLLRAMNERRVEGGGEKAEAGQEKTESRSESPPSAFPLPPSLFLSDRRAWDRLMKALDEGDTLARWIEQRPPELERRAAFEALIDIMASDRVGHSGDESGYVRVLSAESVRSLRIPYLFLAGLSEKAFPPPDREDRLYSEADYLRLIDAGLPLVARGERTREEMLLFYEAVTRATKRLYLSYPAMDEAAQPLLPSPFLSEIEEAFGEKVIPHVKQTDLSPIPPDDEPLCEADFRVKAMATALDGNVALLAGLIRGEGRGARGEGGDGSVLGDVCGRYSSLSPRPSLTAGLELIYLRQGHEGFGPAEGVLQSAGAQAYLTAQFHAQHVFSATELERYASCPFRYFLERILKIEPIEDLSLEFDVMERGRIVHDVLAAFHKRVNAKLGRPGSPLLLDEAEFDALLAEAIQEGLPREPRNPVQAALREVDRRLVVEWLSQYREQIERYDGQWKDYVGPMAPEFFETSFGRGDGQSPTATQPFDFLRDGRTIHISGRIDRIDTGTVAGQTVFNVLDYKTGGTIKLTPESILAGTTLQLPLYAIAAMELLLNDRDGLPWRAGYWYVRDDGFKPKQALVMYESIDGRIELNRQWEDIRDMLGDVVAALVESIRAGRFPVCNSDDRCTGRCPFKTVCRINQVRSLEKKWQPIERK
jgi:ATP-dependent helicase/nuclease subunit B